MKTLFLSLTLSLTLVTGCTTIDGKRAPDVARVARIAGAAADIGTRLYLIDHPGDVANFRLAEASLTGLVDEQNYDPAAFAAALRGLPTKELRGPEGALLVSAAVLLWDELAAEARTLDKTTWVKPVLLSVRDGLRRAIDDASGRTTTQP